METEGDIVLNRVVLAIERGKLTVVLRFGKNGRLKSDHNRGNKCHIRNQRWISSRTMNFGGWPRLDKEERNWNNVFRVSLVLRFQAEGEEEIMWAVPGTLVEILRKNRGASSGRKGGVSK